MTSADWIKAGAPIVSVFLTLIGGWLIGQRVSDRWERRKRQRELDLAALAGLHTSYGEFYAVWKDWNAHVRAQGAQAPPTTRWELLARATTAEGSIEALLVKVVTERKLTPEQVDALGALRQSYRGLRFAIAGGRELAWHYSAHPDYTAFKGLQTLIAGLLTDAPRQRPTTGEAARNLARATANEYEHAWPDVAVQAGVYFPDGRTATELTRPLLRERQRPLA